VKRIQMCLATVLLMACGSCSTPTPSPDAVRAEVQPVIRAYVEAQNKADVTAMMEMISRAPGTSSINDGSITRGWEALRTLNDAVVGKLGSVMVLGSIDVLPLGPVNALVTAPVTTTTTVDQVSTEESGALTLLLEKTAKGWKIIHEHYSSQAAEEGD
jgi:ketosteroid isomerase-like protein